MRQILLLLGFFAGVAVPAGLFAYHYVPSSLNDGPVQWLIAALVVLPVAIGLIGGIALFFQTQTYHYVPLPGQDEEDDHDVHRLEDSRLMGQLPETSESSSRSPFEAFLRARILAICSDVEAGQIHQPIIYHTNVYTQLAAYVQRQQEFLRAGWTIQFQLRAAEPHTLRLVYEFSDDEFLAECEGVFDCVAAYGAVQHSVPLTTQELGKAAIEKHLYPPLIGMPGVMRLRVRRFEPNGAWVITGLYDTVRGLQMGEPVV